MNNQKNEIFGIHRTTLLVLAVAITFGSFSVYKALGGGTATVGRTEPSEVPAISSFSSAILTSATAPSPAFKTTLTPIERIQVGDRVFAESPTGEEDTAFGSEIVPSDWRKLTLRAPKRDGTTAEVVLLRPLTWLNEQHGEVGGTVFISVPECGIDGNALVLAIEPCPKIPTGAGRVVTGTFLHQATSTITLTIAGQSEPIGCTGNHPFWSEDRRDFVRADSLQPGETLRTISGLTTVESWTTDFSQTLVYNIEVHGAHVYHVGTSGVVVHNPNPGDCIKWADEFVQAHGGKAMSIVPNVENGVTMIGKIPGYGQNPLTKNDFWEVHAFVVKNGHAFDELNPLGVPLETYLNTFRAVNGFSPAEFGFFTNIVEGLDAARNFWSPWTH